MNVRGMSPKILNENIMVFVKVLTKSHNELANHKLIFGDLSQRIEKKERLPHSKKSLQSTKQYSENFDFLKQRTTKHNYSISNKHKLRSCRAQIKYTKWNNGSDRQIQTTRYNSWRY